MRILLYQWIHRVWYEGGSGYWLLLPVSGLFWILITLRRYLYRFGLLKQEMLGVPVIVVGNLTAGGTGKTPIVIWLANALRDRGFTPAIVSRGYGGSKSSSPMRVDTASDPAVVGDEPVLLARRSSCAIAVDKNRVRAAAMLIEDGADLIIADDGLQHLRLGRTYEICVVDGARWLGNRFVLPAGPLRETTSRLNRVDQILVNGRLHEAGETANEQNAIEFELVAQDVCRLNGSLSRSIERFGGTTVHGIAAIGNPTRFFDMLRSHNIQVIEHRLPDHSTIDVTNLSFGDDFDILMTEKDAVKIESRVSDRFWYVPVEVELDPVLAGPWLEQIESRMRNEQLAS
ncbi:MAG: tetraacyldisaccharide 4'-kinase [Gammaproteobacteria bacterium]|nr:tetraacyldisaccharide 4'-kinase [Gammaproteobacteria bacterium]